VTTLANRLSYHTYVFFGIFMPFFATFTMLCLEYIWQPYVQITRVVTLAFLMPNSRLLALFKVVGY